MTLRREKFREFYTNIPVYIFALALVMAGVFFLLFLEKFRTYNTEISVIFIPQNEKIAEQTSQIAENLTVIPTKLSFYDRLLSDNKNIEDQFAAFNNDKRKELWNKTVEIKREKDSTIINIEANSPTQSRILAKQTAFTLFNVMSRYYNIKTDIDFRIIDGPVTATYIKNRPILILLSLILGIILAFCINIISLNLAGLFEKRRVREISMEKMFQSFPEEPEIAMPYIAPANAKKAQAPANLPIAQVLPQEPEKTMETIYPAEEEPLKKTEPTEEELKERLNQLLRGEL